MEMTPPSLNNMIKPEIFYIIILISFVSCLEEFSSENTLTFSLDFTGNLRFESQEKMNYSELVIDNNGDFYFGSTSKGPDQEKIGKWIKYDQDFRIKEINWYFDGELFLHNKYCGQDCDASIFYYEKIKRDKIKPPTIEINKESVDTNSIDIIVHSSSYPVNYIKVDCNLPIVKSSFDKISNQIHLSCNKLKIKTKSFLNLTYWDDKKNVLKKDSFFYDNNPTRFEQLK